MNCISPVTLQQISPRYPRGLTVPCGKCIHCKIQRRKEWSIRMLHELDSWDKASFVTLTYDDKHLPISPVGKIGPIQYPWPTLQKAELQKFFKRLRKNYDGKIKYFACGEYGDCFQRPHYHSILFGLGLSRSDRDTVMASWPFCDWENREIRDGSFGIAEPDSIRYVAQYIDKKYDNDEAYKYYHMYGREPVFRLISQGLGKEYIYKNAEQLTTNGYLTHNSIPQSIPRYYLNKLDEIGLKPDLTDRTYEAQCEKNQKLIGLWMSDAEILRANRPQLEDMKIQAEGKGKKQHGLNLQARIAQKQRKL